jgi:hypothetical protein
MVLLILNTYVSEGDDRPPDSLEAEPATPHLVTGAPPLSVLPGIVRDFGVAGRRLDPYSQVDYESSEIVVESPLTGKPEA